MLNNPSQRQRGDKQAKKCQTSGLRRTTRSSSSSTTLLPSKPTTRFTQTSTRLSETGTNHQSCLAGEGWGEEGRVIKPENARETFSLWNLFLGNPRCSLKFSSMFHKTSSKKIFLPLFSTSFLFSVYSRHALIKQLLYLDY